MTCVNVDDTKICIKCGESKSLDNFYRRDRPGGRYYHCKACHAAFVKVAGDKRKEAERPEREANRMLREDQQKQRLESPTKRCSKCGIEKLRSDFYNCKKYLDGKHYSCKACQSAMQSLDKEKNRTRAARWRSNNPERSRNIILKSIRKNAKKRSEATAEWRKANQDHVNAYQAEYDAKRRDQRNIDRRATYAADPDKFRKIAKDYRIANPDKVKLNKYKQRARKHGAPGSHTTQETADLFIRQNCKCANPYCCVDLRDAGKHLDHIQALARGGSNSIKNLQWLCGPCNSRKNTLPMAEWLLREMARSQPRRGVEP